MTQRVNMDINKDLWKQVGIKAIELDMQKKEIVEKALIEFINKKEMDEMTELKVWERENYTVEMVDHDHDLKAFEITQGDKVQVIYPATIEDMEQIITDLNNGEDVDGWEDGLGNTIVID